MKFQSFFSENVPHIFYVYSPTLSLYLQNEDLPAESAALQMVEMSEAIHLYRSLLRQANLLPHAYLRHFYRLRSRDRIHAISKTRVDKRLFLRRLRPQYRELRILQAANNGDVKSLTKVLDEAYGRRGVLSHELIQPLLTDSNQPLPKRIIPQVEKSRPPVYNPLLRLLLSNPQAVRKNVVKQSNFIHPPDLPERAYNPNSPEYRLLGPFSKRREVNMRWRYFTKNAKRLLPPLEVKYTTGAEESSLGLGLGFSGLDVVRHLEDMVGTTRYPTIPRRGHHDAPEDLTPVIGAGGGTESQSALLPTRKLRRQYRRLLGTIPIVTEPSSRRFQISISEHALCEETKGGVGRLGFAKPSDLKWIEEAETKDREAGRGSRK